MRSVAVFAVDESAATITAYISAISGAIIAAITVWARRRSDQEHMSHEEELADENRLSSGQDALLKEYRAAIKETRDHYREQATSIREHATDEINRYSEQVDGLLRRMSQVEHDLTEARLGHEECERSLKQERLERDRLTRRLRAAEGRLNDLGG